MNRSAPLPRTLAPLDFLLAVIFLTGAVAAIPLLRNSAPRTLTVYSRNRVVAEYPLNTNREVTVPGANGPVSFSIREGKVQCTEAVCPLGICKRTGPVALPGQQIVCIPNRISAVITTSRRAGLDGVTR